jgi:hypothetical protein
MTTFDEYIAKNILFEPVEKAISFLKNMGLTYVEEKLEDNFYLITIKAIG